jgi:hypothetical protein
MASEGGLPPHRVPNIAADWLENLVWADVRAFLANPGEVLERVRERMADEDDYAELEERRGSLKKRLTEVEGELDRLSQRSRANSTGSLISTQRER